jgi:hypothetical protein
LFLVFFATQFNQSSGAYTYTENKNGNICKKAKKFE